MPPSSRSSKWWSKRQKVSGQPASIVHASKPSLQRTRPQIFCFVLIFFDVSGWERGVAKPRKSSLQSCFAGCRAEALAELRDAGDPGNVGRAVAGGGGALGARPPGVAQEPLQHGFVTALPGRIFGHVLRSARRRKGVTVDLMRILPRSGTKDRFKSSTD